MVQLALIVKEERKKKTKKKDKLGAYTLKCIHRDDNNKKRGKALWGKVGCPKDEGTFVIFRTGDKTWN